MNEPHIKKLEEIPVLLDLYGCLLTERQKEAVSFCYEEDCSLSEIASLHGSSRQAAYNLIERGEQQLREYESLLHLAEIESQREKSREELTAYLQGLKHTPEEKAKIEELLCLL